MAEPWLSIVGIGEGGIDDLPPQARTAIARAEILFGGRRHLDMVRTLANGRCEAWPSPFDPGMTALRSAHGKPVCVLASGDPMLFGVGATIARLIPIAEMTIHPAPSSFSLAAARIGWPLGEIVTISLHGRATDRIRPLLHPGARILALTSDAADPQRIAALMTEAGFGPSTITVLEALGGPRERIRDAIAGAFDLDGIDPLNLLAIRVAAEADARILPFTSGRADALFDHDGQITKQEIRAIALALLAPRTGELLWDIGAGSGSIGIEWMLAHPSLRTIAIEPRGERLARIARNAALMGVPDLTIVAGRAPDILTGLPTPDAIFIGGGCTTAGLPDAAIAALRPGGRIVAHAVALESEALLIGLHARLGGQLTRVAISRAAPVGGMTGWRSAMPVTIWSWNKP